MVSDTIYDEAFMTSFVQNSTNIFIQFWLKISRNPLRSVPRSEDHMKVDLSECSVGHTANVTSIPVG